MHVFSFLPRDASRYLVEVLESVSASELDDVMEKVLDAVEKQPRTYRSFITVLERKKGQCVTVFR